ncbi:exopolysaccharide biosynthesis polyprenyl glycosylphosphotransferase [uncultured Algimonas sp.]|uniref:exopolysaccharide biosynthesis polyprenyl glycosylphosphotransferase n=1 Tax=uncultured Algimonas sp. TaxID=1547920 RepID=UPI00261FD032|nr:exopolysaccharide biosynthesis polyprenyl glycosylphosphotransferase [uncultured Algimonas sp.]
MARSDDTEIVPAVDRRRKRLDIDGLIVPRLQVNINAARFALQSIDVLAVAGIIALSAWHHYIGANDQAVLAPAAAAIMGAGIFVSLMKFAHAYRFKPTETPGMHLRTVFVAALAALGVWLAAALILRPASFQPDSLARSGLYAVGALMILHALYAVRLKRLHLTGRLAPTVVMLGATESAQRIIEENAKTKELNIVAIFDERLARAPIDIHGVPVVGKIGDLLQWEGLPYVNRIVVTLPSAAAARKKDFVEKVRLLPNRIAYVSDAFENLDHVKQRLSEIAEISLKDVTGNPKSGRHTALKRLSDIILASAALTILAMPMAILALIIRIDSPGPVLFRQPRHGFNNRIFDVLKFRTMRSDRCDLKAERQTEADDPRITRIGRLIRKTSIDELPQLINVIKGEMSLVGPRPHAVGMKTAGRDSMELVEEYAHRHKMKPGMTGWAQINGSRGPLRNGYDVQRRVQLDIEYIERANIIWDIIIMARTIPVLLGDRGTVR